MSPCFVYWNHAFGWTGLSLPCLPGSPPFRLPARPLATRVPVLPASLPPCPRVSRLRWHLLIHFRAGLRDTTALSSPIVEILFWMLLWCLFFFFLFLFDFFRAPQYLRLLNDFSGPWEMLQRCRVFYFVSTIEFCSNYFAPLFGFFRMFKKSFFSFFLSDERLQIVRFVCWISLVIFRDSFKIVRMIPNISLFFLWIHTVILRSHDHQQ